jgi:hypothetical protein
MKPIVKFVYVNISDTFPIQNSLGLIKGDALSPFLFNFSSECAIRKVQEIQGGLKLNGIYQLLDWGNEVNSLGNNTGTLKKYTQTLIVASNEVGLRVNTKKTKYMLLSRHQNAEQNHDIKIGKRSFQIVAQLNCLGKITTNRNLIQEEIKKRLISGNSCYRSIQNILSFHLLYKNVKIRTQNYNFACGFLWV